MCKYTTVLGDIISPKGKGCSDYCILHWLGQNGVVIKVYNKPDLFGTSGVFTGKGNN